MSTPLISEPTHEGPTFCPSFSHGSEQSEQVVLILVGLVASGKSTFAKALEKHFPHFRRCNQDDLGDRRQVEKRARSSLREGLSVCVDRTNFNALQRSYWVSIAREFPGTTIWVIVFDTPYEECARRLRDRTSHPTIKTPEEGMSVLSRLASEFQWPRQHEGYDHIISLLPPDQSPVYSYSDISFILNQLRNSAPIRPPRGIPFISTPGSWRSTHSDVGGSGRIPKQHGRPPHLNNSWRWSPSNRHGLYTARELTFPAQSQGEILFADLRQYQETKLEASPKLVSSSPDIGSQDNSSTLT